MNRNRRNNGISANRVVGLFAAEKKKTVLAVCLITLMAFMWIKVFAAKSPVAAQAAAVNSQAATNSQVDTQAGVSFVDLPDIPGRNDVITRDVFASNGWKNFVNAEKNVVFTGEVNATGKSSEKTIESIVGSMKLEAIATGTNPRALINNKVLSTGDSVLVNNGPDSYECEVIKIDDNSVVIRCGTTEVILKLKQTVENKNQS